MNLKALNYIQFLNLIPMSTESLNIANVNPDLTQISRRRDLLPRWILLLTFLFLIFGAILPIWIISGIFKPKFHITLLGISTHNPLAPVCLITTFYYFYKALVAYALWTEKYRAIKLARVDAIFSILLCCFSVWQIFAVPQGNASQLLNSLISLLISVLYLVKMNKIQLAWETFRS